MIIGLSKSMGGWDVSIRCETILHTKIQQNEIKPKMENKIQSNQWKRTLRAYGRMPHTLYKILWLEVDYPWILQLEES